MNKNFLKILVCLVLAMTLLAGCAGNGGSVETLETAAPVVTEAPVEETPQPNAAAEQAYMAFLNGEISLTTSEKFREDDGEYNYDGLLYGTYSYDQLKAAIAEYEGHGSTTKYALVDLTHDGVNELPSGLTTRTPAFLAGWAS